MLEIFFFYDKKMDTLDESSATTWRVVNVIKEVIDNKVDIEEEGGENLNFKAFYDA